MHDDQLAEAIDAAVDTLSGRSIAVLTGAGISTDSGIPAYRGEGATPRTPMTITEFMQDEGYRRRYWAGSQLGWSRFGSVEPNPGHRALAALERDGVVRGVMTQNVDALHQRAGSTKVVELHGGSDRVRCVRCGQLFSRTAVADTIARNNPWLAERGHVELGPDGDVDVGDLAEMVVPECDVCGGILRPDIVYFGEFIPREKNQQASGLIGSADALLVVGSSLVVNSGIRMLDQALRRDHPVVIINRGHTRGDSRATVKIDAGATPSLVELAARLNPES